MRGNISAQQVARAAPDGYTLFVTFGGVHDDQSVSCSRRLGFDPDKDFIPITEPGVGAISCSSVNPDVVPCEDREGVHRLR